MEPTSAQPKPRRLLKWLAGILVIGAICVSAVVFSIPWLVDRPFVRERIAKRANEILAPGRVSFDHLATSWFGPSELSPLELRDHENRPVVIASRATLDWNLWQLLFTQPKVANVTLTDCQADIIREGNGSINLIETLQPVLVPKPEHTVAIRIPQGRIQFRAAPEANPFVGERAEMQLTFAAYPEPITWDIKLAQPSQDATPGTLAFKGRADRVSSDGVSLPEVEVALSSERWGWTTGQTGSAVKGTIGASLDARRRQGRWASTGKATVENIVTEPGATVAGLVSGKMSGATKAEWKIVDSKDGWDVEKIRLESSLAKFDAHGTVAMQPGADWTLALDAVLSGFELPDPRDPAKTLPQTLKSSIKLVYDPRADRAELSGLDLGLPMVRVQGGGTIAGLTSQRAMDFRGTLEPDWKTLQQMLAEKVEPNARLTGRPRGWSLKGTIPSFEASELSKTLEGEAGVELEQVDVFGMRLSRTALVGRIRNGKLSIDPIESTLNGGILHLEPTIITEASGRRLLSLGSASYLNDAEVNEEVSHRVLSFVAPVMDQATRVSGRVSLAIADAVFPLDAGSADLKPKLEGEVSFEQVEFAPGPFANTILDTLAPNRNRQPLVLNDPVSMTIVDSRVYQEGLAIPLGKAAEVGMDGSVGFDRTLDLTAHVTLTPDKSGTNPPIVASIFRGTKFAFPIRGTFDKPKLDTKALGENFKDLGAGLLERTLSSATGGIIPNVDILKDLFGGPRNRRGGGVTAPKGGGTPPPPKPMIDPETRQAGRQEPNITPGATPPPPKPMVDEDDDSSTPEANNDLRSLFPPIFKLTPEERRERRQERKLERMRKRGLIP